MRIPKLVLALALALPAAEAQVQPQTFSFEAGEASQAFTFFRLNPYCLPFSSGSPGYQNAPVSGTCAAYGPGDGYPSLIQNSTPFRFQSAYFTSAEHTDATMTVWGFRPGDQMPSLTPWIHAQLGATYFAQFLIDWAAPTMRVFDWSGVTTVALSSRGGIQFNSAAGPSGEYFAVDDVAVSSVTAAPEPASSVLLATGLLAIAAIARRRRTGSSREG